MRIYYKVSKDEGSTWGPETLLDNAVAAFTLRMLYTCPRLYKGPPVAAWVRDAQTDDLQVSVEMVEPRATYIAGLV
jgi:hypothetical protein